MANTCINTAGVQLVRDHLGTLPRPDREARKAIQGWLNSQGVSLDPDHIDVVTLHLHPDRPGHYQGQIKQRVSLTQAVLINWQGESADNPLGALIDPSWAGQLPTDGIIEIVDQLPSQPITDNSAWYQVFNGLFRRTEPAEFNTSTLLDIRAEALHSHIEALDFHTHYASLLDDYWQTHTASHRLCCKVNFIAACNKQVAEGSLSDAARKLAWRAAELIARGDGLRLRPLNIYGYAATDLLCIADTDSGLTLLYVPGNSSPLLEFAHEDLLKDWIAEQCKDAIRRQQFKHHFRLADAPQGVDFSGLDTALEGLAAYPSSHTLPPEHGPFNDDGTWPPRTYVNYRPETYSPDITGDLFQALTARQRQRCYDDADFIITSNREINESKWLSYLNATLNLMLPLTFVVPGLAPLLAVGGIVQMGLGLDQAINGKTLRNKLDGVGNITYGLFNAVPLAVGVVRKADALFEAWQDGFVAPARINDQIGYPLSPLDTPHLPPVDIAPYFHRPAAIEPLAEGNPLVAAAVRRVPRYNGELDSLVGYHEPYPGYAEALALVYDMESDLFIAIEDLNEVHQTFYEAEPDTGNIRQAMPQVNTVTQAMRTATLRALGVDLPLPFELPAAQIEGASAIPKQISSLWVGDKLLSPPVIDNLASNARTLSTSPYQYRLFLSTSNPEAFAHNLAQLSEKAPGLQVLPLEEQAFFKRFEQHAHFAQYQAATDGSAGKPTHFASASDILRYPMLYSEGGLYLDVDDYLFTLGEDQGMVSTDAAIDSVELATTADGLLLHPVVQNESMGMNSMFNNSMIGSHAGNPTLLAISEEMNARYLADPQFYQLRANKQADPAGFYRFARKLSRLTGPALLNDVVDRLLPDLYRLRQISNLYMLPRINSFLYVDLEAFKAVTQARLPLMQVGRIGNLHSWSSG